MATVVAMCAGAMLLGLFAVAFIVAQSVEKSESEKKALGCFILASLVFSIVVAIAAYEKAKDVDKPAQGETQKGK